MAFLQSELPPSTAPVSPARSAPSRTRPLPASPRRMRLIANIAAALLLTAPLAILAIAAARATESLAIGIIAADMVFLLGVAGWSAVAGGRR